MSKLTLTLFGPPAITLDNQSLHVGRRKAVALLAYLAVTSRRCSRRALGNLLWPAYDERAALAEVRRALSTLKQKLGNEWLAADHQDIVLLSTADLWIDVLACRDDLTAVLTPLAADLPPGQMAASQEQGQQRELADLVQELLGEW